MSDPTRAAARLAGTFVCLVVLLTFVPVTGSQQSRPGGSPATNARGEGQPAADLGNGSFLNPILPGEYPDPSVVRVGHDYYMTNTSGTGSPGLLVWHSRDLVNWVPLGPALTHSPGDVWAPEITHHDGLFYIYFPALVASPDGKGRRTNFVITARDPRGPWTEPIDLNVGGIDPGHVVDGEGRRFLYLDDGKVVPLSPDGLRVTGSPTKRYDGWDIPADWNIECKCLESPKLFVRGGFYYLVSAQGGTAGPSTSHMIVVARARSPLGPWENMPSNPLLRTRRRSERWWSQGHGTIVEGTDVRWWVVYHASENGYRTLGRQTLLLPVDWTTDGWPQIPADADPGKPLRKPAGDRLVGGLPLSDRFAGQAIGWQWRRWERDPAAVGSYQVQDGALSVAARGTGPSDAALITLGPVNHAYEVQVEVSRAAGAESGLLLHYDAANFGGLGVTGAGIVTYLKGKPNERVPLPESATRVLLRIQNLAHDVRLFYSLDGAAWVPLEMGMEMSGYHHDTLRNWSWLKVGLYAAGTGTARFRDFRYRGLGSEL